MIILWIGRACRFLRLNNCNSFQAISVYTRYKTTSDIVRAETWMDNVTQTNCCNWSTVTLFTRWRNWWCWSRFGATQIKNNDLDSGALAGEGDWERWRLQQLLSQMIIHLLFTLWHTDSWFDSINYLLSEWRTKSIIARNPAVLVTTWSALI